MVWAVVAAALAAAPADTELVRGFTDVAFVGPNAFISSSDGTLRTLNGAEVTVAITTGRRMLGLTVSADGQRVAAVGAGVIARSEDGGRIFRLDQLPDEQLAWTAAFVGRALLVFDAKGHIWRTERSSHFVELPSPLFTRWYASSFEGDRGYVVGENGGFIRTNDGGRSWTKLLSPDPQPQGVVGDGDRVFISGRDGVYRSDDRGESFKRIFAVPGLRTSDCGRITRRGKELAVACAPTGHALYVSQGGDHFDEVKVPEAGNLVGVSIGPAGELVAVGAYELVVRANNRYGSVLVHSDEVRRWMQLIRRMEEERAQQATKKRTPSKEAGVIKGMIRDDLGRPLPGVTLSHEPSWAWEGQQVQHTVSKPDGSFEFKPTTAKQVRLSVESPGYARILRLVDVDELDATWLDLRFDKAVELAGQLLSKAGQPVAGKVELFPVPPPNADRTRWTSNAIALGSASAGTDGRFTITGVPSGEALLRVRPEAGAEFSIFVRAPDEDLKVELQEGARVSGRFVNADGSAISNAQIALDDQAKAATDSLGQFVIAGLTDGDYELTATDLVTRTCLRRTVHVSGGVASELTLQLGKGQQIRGRVTDGLGQPIAGARVLGITTEDVRCGARSTETDGRGEFTLTDVQDQPYTISVLAPGERLKSGQAVNEVRAMPGETRAIVIRR